MAKLTISDASRVAGVARSTLHRAVRQGRLSLDPDGQVDTAELLRAGYTLQGHTLQARSTPLQEATPPLPDALQAEHPASTLLLEALQRERTLLQEQLDATRELLQGERQAAQDRERRAADREALLLLMLQDAQQRTDRLLEAPRPAPPAAPAPAIRAAEYQRQVAELLPQVPYTHLDQPPARATPPSGTSGYRGVMRQRVLQALQGYPQGCHHAVLEHELGVDRPLTDVLTGMWRDGLLVRVKRGVYRLPDG